MSILEQLYALQDTGYADFQSGLVPNIPRERFIGVRMPNMRRLAKQMAKEDAAQAFMAAVPHTYYDENILHALLICEKRDYEACVQAIDAFLPYVDNWAVCDILSPKALSKKQTRPAQSHPPLDSFSASLHLPLRHGDADDVVSGCRLSARISGASRWRPFGRILRPDDDRVVFRHRAGKAVGRFHSVFAAAAA